MATITTKSSDFENLIYSHAIDNKKRTYWEEMLGGITAQQAPQYEAIQSAYTSQAKAAEQAASYDISAAYANYKKQQLALMANQNIGSGYRAKQEEALDTAYNEAFDYYKTNLNKTLGTLASQEASDIAGLASQRASAMQATTQNISEQAQKLSELQNLMFEHIGEDELEKWTRPISEGGYGYYDVSYGGDGTAIYTQTGYGQNYWDKFFNSPSQEDMQFWDKLRQDNQELYDWAVNNMNEVRNYIGNITSTNTEFTEDDTQYTEAQKVEDYYNRYYAGENEKTPTFTTNTDKINYYNQKISEAETREYAKYKPVKTEESARAYMDLITASAQRNIDPMGSNLLALYMYDILGKGVARSSGDKLVIDTNYLTKDAYEQLTGKKVDYDKSWKNSTITFKVSNLKDQRKLIDIIGQLYRG